MADIVWAIGLMSGTSMDGIDAALIRTDGEKVFDFGPALSIAYEQPFQDRIRAVLGLRETNDTVNALEEEITLKHADAVKALLEKAGISAAEVAYIGFHGQTINHVPSDRFTWQLGKGALLARETGIPVVYDFRSQDVAAGGEGAPLAPVYHGALALGLEKPVVFVNIGGVSNITYVGSDGGLIAFDTGPGNGLMDDLMLEVAGQAYDEAGKTAAKGQVDRAVLSELMDHPYFRRKPPKSLDRHDFSKDPVEGLALEDAMATLAAFTKTAILRAMDYLPERPRTWLICGGGRHNATLMGMMRRKLPGTVEPVDLLGLDGDMIEAQAFALMAVRSARGLPISFPKTTNAPRPLAGGHLVKPDWI
ncbi:anhydro-N-acetylmuramic acid kinase [Aestuariispira insulae]|uniref:Anhydro-N-acetylmuramic acid kinase n=1 Tax=Aestuariispira insulae TaxID=1461337 RepID=A0A3D9HW00_9PROT|nr:anhydro-N-acetylmuramic acid kinase [Aestuariispira insulae]RED53647.1 anhydro-N-acetylmuramic acid kinase [Aestuariispira insulae]